LSPSVTDAVLLTADKPGVADCVQKEVWAIASVQSVSKIAPINLRAVIKSPLVMRVFNRSKARVAAGDDHSRSISRERLITQKAAHSSTRRD
jgi:hypothetical protein